MTELMEQVNNDLFLEPFEKVKTDVEAMKDWINGLNPDHVEMALKALPVLIPYVIGK